MRASWLDLQRRAQTVRTSVYEEAQRDRDARGQIRRERLQRVVISDQRVGSVVSARQHQCLLSGPGRVAPSSEVETNKRRQHCQLPGSRCLVHFPRGFSDLRLFGPSSLK